MNSIEKALINVVRALVKDVKEVDRQEITTAWNEYHKLWPGVDSAMKHLQDTLLMEIVKKYGKSNQSAIILGQCMKNLSWALKKKHIKSKDNFLKKL